MKLVPSTKTTIHFNENILFEKEDNDSEENNDNSNNDNNKNNNNINNNKTNNKNIKSKKQKTSHIFQEKENIKNNNNNNNNNNSNNNETDLSVSLLEDLHIIIITHNKCKQNFSYLTGKIITNL